MDAMSCRALLTILPGAVVVIAASDARLAVAPEVANAMPLPSSRKQSRR